MGSPVCPPRLQSLHGLPKKNAGERKNKMSTAFKIEPKSVDQVPFQEASLDIWDKKYRLTAKDGTPVDGSMDDTYQRVAKALAEVEKADLQAHWHERFLWALRKGAIPAGRVL
jgi:ribonucleoside-diphosphate reductase alpha chain